MEKKQTFATSLMISVFFLSTSREAVGGATGLRGFTGRSLESQTEHQCVTHRGDENISESGWKSNRTRQTQERKDFKQFYFRGFWLVRVNTGVRSGISHLRVAGGGPSFFSTAANRDSWPIGSETELWSTVSAELCLTVLAGSGGARDFFTDLTLNSIKSLSSMSSSNGFKLWMPAACFWSPWTPSTTDGAFSSFALLSANTGLDGAGPLPCLTSVTGPLTVWPSLASSLRCGETLSVLPSWAWFAVGGCGAARFSRRLHARSLWSEEVVAFPGDNGAAWLLEKKGDVAGDSLADSSKKKIKKKWLVK